jgi:hypothetical protein
MNCSYFNKKNCFLFSFVVILVHIYYYGQNSQFQLVKFAILPWFQEKSISNGHYAAISIDLDTNREFYVFYLPITCLSWRIVNFEPIILAAVSNSTFSNKLVLKTLEYLDYFKFKVIFLKTSPDYSTMTGMISRLLIGLVDELSENDFIFQTDADLLPINKTYYNKFDNTDSLKHFDVSSFQTWMGEFGYNGTNYMMLFMGHIGMTKKQWRDVMLFNETMKLDAKLILDLVRQFYGNSSIKKNNEFSRGDDAWFLDQKIVSINIARYLKKNNNSKMYKNMSPGIKLDRIWSDEKWLDTFKNKYDAINDVHLFHENYKEKLHFLDLLCKKMFNKQRNTVLERYINEFMALKNFTFKINSIN